MHPEYDAARSERIRLGGGYIIPTVTEVSKGQGERRYDLFSRLLNDRIIFLGTEIDDMVANIVIGQLLFLNMENPEKEITMYINSPGGSINAGNAIMDTMHYVDCPVSTVCTGMSASMGAWLLASGTPGLRKSLPSSRIMIHQPLSGVRGQATDILIHAREIERLRDEMYAKMAEFSGKPVAQVAIDCERDNYLTAVQAKEYGIIDEIIKISRVKPTAEEK